METLSPLSDLVANGGGGATLGGGEHPADVTV